MKLIQIVFSIYIGLLFSVIFALLWSEASLNHYQELAAYKDSLTGNIKELEKINENLTIELDSLLHDKEMIRIYSRNLGFYDKSEKVIKIEGYTPQKSFYDIGKLIKKAITGVDYSQPLRIIGLLLPVLIYVLSVFVIKMVKRDRKTNRSGFI